MRNIISNIKKDLKDADSTSKIVIFLGGTCLDENAWRKEIKADFGDHFHFIDPFDEGWVPEDNIYSEIEGMLKSSYIFFYKPGKLSKKEKKFLDSVNIGEWAIQDFKTLEDMKLFLKSLKLVSKGVPASRYLSKCANEILKESMPHLLTKEDEAIDLYLELMGKDDILGLMEDFKKGKDIKIPELEIKGRHNPEIVFNRDDVDSMQYYAIMHTMENMYNVKKDQKDDPSKMVLKYDKDKHTYKKEAKFGVKYDHSCIMVDLPKSLSKDVISWCNKNISEDTLYKDGESYGRENHIHVTLFYGLKDGDIEEVKKIAKRYDPFQVRLGLVTAFKDKDDYDVLKIDIESGDLQKFHYDIDNDIDNENSYPTYSPHVTIAYLKKGEANKYIGDESFKGKTFKVNKIVFSTGDQDQVEVSL